MMPPKAPLFPDVGLLAMPYHHFGSSWMTPHHVLTRLANYFEVVWMEPAHHWRETPRIRNRQAAMDKFARDLPSSFRVYVPEPWFPDVYASPWLRQLLLCARVRHGWRMLERRGCKTFILYLWHHQYESALAVGRQDLSLYHIEDEYSFAPEPPPMEVRELRLIREVNQVFVHSPQLMERKGWINPNTAFIPNGVDYKLYSTPIDEPKDIASIRHPRIGYTGHLKRQLDWALLWELAVRHPDWSFVLVGARNLPENTGAVLDKMCRLPNVYLLGRKTVTELAAYPQHFDVCTMPYIVNGYTQNIYPMKLHEYLASGRPVVGAPIRSLKDFAHVISLASTADEWSQGLGDALRSPIASPEAARLRQETARQNDWNELVYRIVQRIRDRIGYGGQEPFRKLDIELPALPQFE
jgi:glycosyltransferase involved in cell wall biosynthesis